MFSIGILAFYNENLLKILKNSLSPILRRL